jgi:hypothetical protein
MQPKQPKRADFDMFGTSMVSALAQQMILSRRAGENADFEGRFWNTHRIVAAIVARTPRMAGDPYLHLSSGDGGPWGWMGEDG